MRNSHDIIQIDGSSGEGGGQILRTGLSLSAITGRPFRIHSIRANRPMPGLRRQHATAVRAASRICGGSAVGDEVGSRELQFYPGMLRAGDYTFDVGSAGSTMLVLQTILPPLLVADGPSRLELIGGTHNSGAPPFDYLAQAFVPLINRMGASVTVTIERHGFVPRGGGRVRVEIRPAGRLEPIDLRERGAVRAVRLRALVAGLPADIARRELDTASRVLKFKHSSSKAVELPQDQGPGNILLIEVESERVTEVFTGFGQKGMRAEDLARDAATRARSYMDAGVPVGEHLADQLMLPLALAGAGSYITGPLSLHAITNIETIGRFLAVRFDARQVEASRWLVEARSM